MTALVIRKTRKAVWFPGTHADVGGNGSNQVVALHALATVLREFESISRTGNLGVAFDYEEVKAIFDQIDHSETPEETKTAGFVARTLRRVSRRVSRRRPHAHTLVQHFGHPLCRHYAGASAILEEFPEYPE